MTICSRTINSVEVVAYCSPRNLILKQGIQMPSCGDSLKNGTSPSCYIKVPPPPVHKATYLGVFHSFGALHEYGGTLHEYG